MRCSVLKIIFLKINRGLHAFALNNRSLIEVNGRDVRNFLQAVVTNDVFQLQPDKTLYSYILNPQVNILQLKGRILYDIFLYENKDNILLECNSDVVLQLINYLKKFVLRKHVQLQISSLKIFAVDQTVCVPNSVIYPDPRYPELDDYKGDDNDNSYMQKRYSLGIGEGTIDLPIGGCLPLESNGDFLNASCYIGQELTSRTHHTGVIRKRLMPLNFVDECFTNNIKPGTDILLAETLKKCGIFRNLAGNVGLGLLKIQESLNQLLLLHDIDGKPRKLTTHLPSWWSSQHTHI